MQRKPTPEQFTLGYLKFYKNYRAWTENNIFSNVSYFLISATSTVTGVRPNRDMLDEIVLEVKKRVRTAKTNEAKCHLVVFMRKKADEAQLAKYAKGSSKLHGTLHACANAYLDFMENTQEFTDEILKLRKKYEDKIDEREKDIKENQGINKKKLTNELKEVVYALASLRDEKFVTFAIQDFKLFPFLTVLNDEIIKTYKLKGICNHALPLEFQKTYEKGLYAIDYKDYDKKAYNDFSDFSASCCDIQLIKNINNSTSGIENKPDPEKEAGEKVEKPEEKVEKPGEEDAGKDKVNEQPPIEGELKIDQPGEQKQKNAENDNNDKDKNPAEVISELKKTEEKNTEISIPIEVKPKPENTVVKNSIGVYSPDQPGIFNKKNTHKNNNNQKQSNVNQTTHQQKVAI